MKTILIIICVVLVGNSLAQNYEGDRCVDKVTDGPGRCCPVDYCGSAQDDFRQRRAPPNICSFNSNTPVVCCRSACGSAPSAPSAAATVAPAVDSPRISEFMCEEYDKVPAAGQRKKRHYDYDDYGYSHHDYHQMHPQEAYPERSPEPRSAVPDHKNWERNTSDSHTHTDMGFAAVGGVDVTLFEFPHMAAVGWPKINGSFAFLCGGSMISERFVLTAGHCLSNPRDTSLASSAPTIVRLGDHNILDSTPDGAEPRNVPILRMHRHPRYSPPIKYFDIALLELESSVPLSDEIRPACLWTQSDFGSNTDATVLGWGTTVSGGRDNSPVLQKVDVNILDTNVCQPLLRSSRNRNWQGFQDHQLCAGVLAGGKDACQGDSGGPLQIKAQGFRKKLYVIGVTSFGRECGKRNQPGVYSRVSSFLDWIEPIVWPER